MSRGLPISGVVAEEFAHEKTRTVDEATGGHYLKSGDKLSTSSYKDVLTDKFAVLPHLIV